MSMGKGKLFWRYTSATELLYAGEIDFPPSPPVAGALLM